MVAAACKSKAVASTCLSLRVPASVIPTVSIATTIGLRLTVTLAFAVAVAATGHAIATVGLNTSVKYVADSSKNQNNLNQHMRTHMLGDKYCPACGTFASSSVSGVTMHVENGHCPACRGRGRGLVKDFMRHNAPQFMHPAICDGSASESADEDPYCRLCEQHFQSFGALLQHNEAKHAQRGPQLRLTGFRV